MYLSITLITTGAIISLIFCHIWLNSMLEYFKYKKLIGCANSGALLLCIN